MSDYEQEDSESGDKPNPYDEFRAKYAHLGDSITDLARAMEAAQQVAEAAKAASKLATAEYDFMRLVLIPEKCEQQGVEGMKIEGLGRLGLTADMYVSIKAGCTPAMMEWLRDAGKGDLIKEQINSSSLKAVVKDLIKKGEEIPEELLNVNPFTRASITRK